MRHKKQERNKANNPDAIHIAIDLNGIRIKQSKRNRHHQAAQGTQFQQERRAPVDFHLHDEQKSRKKNPRLRHANPKNKKRLGEFPVTTIVQKQVKGRIPERAPHRKQEEQAQGDKNYSNDFAVQN